MKKVLKCPVFWVALVAFAISIAFFVFASVNKVGSDKKLSAYTRIEAVVVDSVIVDGTGPDGTSTLAPVVEFTVDGITYRVKSNISSNERIANGTRLKIAYNPENPKDCVFIDNENTWNTMLFVFGGVFFLAGVFTCVLLRKTLK